MSTEYDITRKYFPGNVSKRERAIFECGIALATIYHAFTGIPIRYRNEDTRSLEKTIEKSILAQPFRESVKIKIVSPEKGRGRPFPYFVLRGRYIVAEVIINYLGEKVRCKMEYKDDLDYTLMHLIE